MRWVFIRALFLAALFRHCVRGSTLGEKGLVAEHGGMKIFCIHIDLLKNVERIPVATVIQE